MVEQSVVSICKKCGKGFNQHHQHHRYCGLGNGSCECLHCYPEHPRHREANVLAALLNEMSANNSPPNF